MVGSGTQQSNQTGQQGQQGQKTGHFAQ